MSAATTAPLTVALVCALDGDATAAAANIAEIQSLAKNFIRICLGVVFILFLSVDDAKVPTAASADNPLMWG